MKACRDYVYCLIAFFAVILAWEAVVKAGEVPDYVFPAFSDVMISMKDNLGVLFKGMFITLSESVCGFLLSVSAGFFLSVIMVHSRLIENILSPLLVILYATPVIALAPFVLFWFGFGFLSKIVISSLVSFFPVVVNLNKGFRSVSQEQLDLLCIYNASKKDVFLKARLPSSLPYFFVGLKVAITLSVVGAVVGEFVGADSGVGYLIMQFQSHYNIAGMFGALIVLSLMSVSLYGVLKAVEKRVLKYHV